MTEPLGQRRAGLAYAFAAYGIWGLFPLYFPLLEPTGALEILVHRMIWSLVFVALILTVRGQWAWVVPLWRDRRRFLLLVCAAALISVNWGVYIWAVNAGHVVEAALGYFVTPLVSIALGVVVLRERLRRTQWAAVLVGAIAVVVISVGYGHFPWIALSLAASFGCYGLAKKLAATGAVESLAVETAVMALPAFAYLGFLEARGTATFGHTALHTDALLVSAGAVTAVPLLLFASATRRAPLTLVGLVQYLTPILQFLVGRFVRHEAVSGGQLAGFALVWVALLILGAGEVALWRTTRRQPVGRAAALVVE